MNYEKKQIQKILKELLSFDTDNTSKSESGITLPLLEHVKNLLDNDAIQTSIQKYSFSKTTDGVDTTFDGRGNLIASIKNCEKPKVILQGHVDTVPATSLFTPVVTEEYAVGRGSVDMKGPIAGLINTFITLANKRDVLEFSPVLVLTSDEEANNFSGIKNFIKCNDVGDVKFGICAEPTSLQVMDSLYGAMYIKIVTRGVQGHSALPSENAIEEMNKVITLINQFKKTINARNILNFGVIRGGTKVNITPAKCELEISLRNVTSCKELGNELKSKLSSTNAEVTVVFGYDPIEVKMPRMFEERLKKAFHSVRVNYTKNQMVQMSEATCLNKANIPTIVLGPGDPKLAHVDPKDERIGILQIEIFSKILENIFLTI